MHVVGMCVFLSAQVVRERLVCYAILGRHGRHEPIMTVDVTCRFVDPVLSISTEQLNFYIEKVIVDIALSIIFLLLHYVVGVLQKPSFSKVA